MCDLRRLLVSAVIVFCSNVHAFKNDYLNIRVGLDCNLSSGNVDVITEIKNTLKKPIYLDPAVLGLTEHFVNAYKIYPDYPIGEIDYKQKAKFRGEVLVESGPAKLEASRYKLNVGERVFIRDNITRMYRLDLDYRYHVFTVLSYIEYDKKFLHEAAIKFMLDKSCFSFDEVKWMKEVGISWGSIPISGKDTINQNK